MIQQQRKRRLHLIDEYRGFVVLNMIAYHAVWDLVYMFGQNWQWYKSELGFVWQQWICWSFILVSGFCWNMGKKHFCRGMQVYAAGMLVSLVTVIAMPGAKVMFGVLTLIGSAMILMIPVDLLIRKIPPILGAGGSFLLFLFTYPVNRGYFGFGTQKMVLLPQEWYANAFTTYLGFMEEDFFSTDYFSILPWFFLFVTGYFFYKILFCRGINLFPSKTDDWSPFSDKQRQGNRQSGNEAVLQMLEKSICPPLGWIGRNALFIYLLHQPVIYAVLWIWNRI